MTDYYEELIENITEQLIEQEVLEDIEEIRVDANEKIGVIEQSALDNIEEIRVDTVGVNSDAGYVGSVKDNALTYIETKKEELCSFGNEKREYAVQVYEDIVQINDDTDAIAENTIVEIEYNIRQMIVDNGYVMKITDDGNGNADIVLTTEVS